MQFLFKIPVEHRLREEDLGKVGLSAVWDIELVLPLEEDENEEEPEEEDDEEMTEIIEWGLSIEPKNPGVDVAVPIELRILATP